MLKSLVVLTVIVLATTVSAQSPRYRFEPGQELQLSGYDKHWYGDELTEDTSSWRMWVTRTNDDGSCDMVVEADLSDGAKRLFRATIFPDGSVDWNETMAELPAWQSVRRILPKLPNSVEQSRGVWEIVESHTGMRWKYTGQARDGEYEIKGACQGPLEDVSLGSIDFVWTFDTQSGRITRCQCTGTWENYGERDEQRVEATEPIVHDAVWTDRFRNETQRYFQTVVDYRKRYAPSDFAILVRRASSMSVDALLQEAREMLEAAQETCGDPLVQQYFQSLIDDNNQRAKWITPKLEQIAKIVDKPAPNWTAVDLSGKEHTLADYRGKVLVLDFWFRKCNYCIRTQPQFDAVIERFKGQPVQFVGMNVDEDPADAKFAVDQLGTTYLTLMAKSVIGEYSGAGCPTWVVIDPEGVVRSVHYGFTGLLQEQLGDSIAKLLLIRAQVTRQVVPHCVNCVA